MPLTHLMLTALVAATLLAPADAAEPKHIHLFHSGEEGYPRYRIPSLVVAADGTLLAICEGRKDGGGLQGNVDLVMKRSIDHGKTWGPLERIADAGNDTLGNPCVVLDRKTHWLWLAFTRSPGEHTEEAITKGKTSTSTRVFVTHSKDHGAHWSPPREITATTKLPGWTWYGTGPGVGIQLASGRLLIPSYHAEGDQGAVKRSHVIYSDDGGKHWKLGGNAGSGNGECQALQRADGTLYLSARTAAGGPFRRSVVTSSDDGLTWSKKQHDDALYDPHCEASLLALPHRRGGPRGAADLRWLYCHPAGPKRHNLTVRLSRDEGRTWPQAILLRSGDSQYSSMAFASDGSVCCFYDCWEDGNYQLYVTRFSPDRFSAN